MTLMTEEQKGTYLAGLAREKQGYEARLAVVADALAGLGDPEKDTPDAKVRRQQFLNQQETLQGRIEQVDAEAKRVRSLKAKRAEG